MSRVGSHRIVIPKGVEVSLEKDRVRVKGPKGLLESRVPPELSIKLQDGQISVTRSSNDRLVKSLHGTIRNGIQNMVRGVSEGYTKVLEIKGVGYRAQVQGKKLTFSLGYSHPIEYKLPEGIEATVDKQTTVTLKGINRYLIGQVAANIRALRSPEPYKGKGIKYADEVIRRKEGKTGKGK